MFSNKIFVRKIGALLLAATIFFPASFAHSINRINFPREQLEIESKAGIHAFNTEIATTEAQLEQGLMYRTSLAENEAMIFVFKDEKKVRMWMKNTLISLDMLFIDKDGKIIYIAHDTKPNSLDVISAGDAEIHSVLELKAGVAVAQNISVGDKIISKVFEQ